MLSARLLVVNTKGMHLQAAGELVKVTGRYKAKVTLGYRGTKVNGKSLLSIVSLGVPCGSSFYVYVEGSDARRLLAEMRQLVASGFGAGEDQTMDVKGRTSNDKRR